jgi:hypothetical protein
VQRNVSEKIIVIVSGPVTCTSLSDFINMWHVEKQMSINRWTHIVIKILILMK